MLISQNALNDLKEYANKSTKGVERILLHEKSSDQIQLMCIAFAKNKSYPPHAYKHSGFITYILLEGKLQINIYDLESKKIERSIILDEKEIFKVPRNKYRETIDLYNGTTVFIEVVEGSFQKENEIIIQKK